MAYNVSVSGTCKSGRGTNAFSCEGIWLLPSDNFIELTAFVDNTVGEFFWMDGRVVYTSALPYTKTAGGMSVRASTAGPSVALASVEIWELGSCWINETTALGMLSNHHHAYGY